MTLLTPDLKKVLLIKRATDPHAGSWALPGGFMDAGEGPQVTARRELDEEAKVSAVEGDLHCLGAWPGLHVPAAEITTVNLHYLGIHDQLSEPVAGSDSLAVAWVPIEDVGELPFKNQRQAWACAQRWIANQVGQAR